MRFNPGFAALALAASAAVVSLGAQATTVDVKVIGTITPGACTPTVAGGGTVDYGLIGVADVSQAAFTALPEKTVALSIACDAPTRVALRAVDNKSSSLVSGVTASIDAAYTDAYNFGMGTMAGANVGGYVMRVKQGTFTADGNNVATISSSNGGTTWNWDAGGVTKSVSNLMSWSATNNGPPIAFRTLSGTFSVQAALNKGSDLTLTNDVPLDGSATLEMVYL